MSADNFDSIALERLSQYIAIRTDHPEPLYTEAVSFICEYAKEIGLEFLVVHLPPRQHPAVLVSWKSECPTSVRSVLLNSHMDVVPVIGKEWKTDPFVLHRSDTGILTGRGTQDMKSIAIQQMEAVRRLKVNGTTLKCNVHLSFVPEEEVGSENGMKVLCRMKEFTDLNVVVALDEGVPSPLNMYAMFTEERIHLWLKIRVVSEGGHGSLPAFDHFAMERFFRIYQKLTGLRTDVTEADKGTVTFPSISLGSWTTVNCTHVSSGSQVNVIPSSVEASFDIRTLQKNCAAVIEKIKMAASEEGGEIVDGLEDIPQDRSEQNLKSELAKIVRNSTGGNVMQIEFPGSTDSRFLRELGICCLNFTPMINTEIRIHGSNEFCHENEFLAGIDVIKDILIGVSELVASNR